MIAYVRQCFPGAAVPAERQRPLSEPTPVRTDGPPSPMLDYQRGAARNTGAAFMAPMRRDARTLGGMEQFVKNGWASRFTITVANYAGGRRRVAW